MKKALLIAGLFTLSISAFAQSKIGVHASVIGADISESFEGETEFEGNVRIAYRAGVQASLPLSSQFSLVPQLNFVSKGTRIDQSGSIDFLGMSYTYTAKGYSRMNYLELPVHFVFNTTNAKGNQFYFGAGPSVSFGIGGKGKLEVYENEDGDVDAYTKTVKFKFDGKDNATTTDENYYHYKRWEVGVSVLAGYQLSENFFVNAHFNKGLNNVNADKTDNGKTKSMYGGVGIGYYFSR